MSGGKASLRPVVKHGHSPFRKPSPTYKSWYSMIQRCTNPRNASWKTHGSRGVSVCSRWLGSFENFLADVGERLAGTTLDRYPNARGNYEPGNVRWATPSEQRRNSSRMTIGFEEAVAISGDLLRGLFPTEIARKHGVKRHIVRSIQDGEAWRDAYELARCIHTHTNGEL